MITDSKKLEFFKRRVLYRGWNKVFWRAFTGWERNVKVLHTPFRRYA